MSSKVSIIVPIYNAEKCLVQCVESLVQQDYGNIEILLIDDGSTDNSSAICDELQLKYERIRAIHKENGGTASARNLGVSEASGDYVMFIDSDDWFELDTVSTLVSHMDTNCLDIARFNYVREFGDRSLEKKNTFLEERVYEGEECRSVCRQVLGLTDSELAHPENMNFLSSVCFNIYRRKLILDNGLRFENFHEIGSFVDGLFNFDAFNYVKRFEFIDRAFYHYRKTNNASASKKYRSDYLSKQGVLFDKLEKVMEKHNITDYARSAYCSRVVYNSMEMCFNALRSSNSFSEKRQEIKAILKNSRLKKIRKGFKLKQLPLKWKVYFFFIKKGWTLPTYLMTALILKMKNKGA